ncbi:MAG TPA: hypothetical protein VKU87_09860 [Thermomicrobiaceae bacterium]|nr:hypothetical protein [Thermomicrobiaceae bacterium]
MAFEPDEQPEFLMGTENLCDGEEPLQPDGTFQQQEQAEPSLGPNAEWLAGEDPSARETLTGIGRRLPRYARLASSLAADTRLDAQQRRPLTGILGRGLPMIDLLPGLIPIVGRFDGLLGLFSAILYALRNMQAEDAEYHLQAVGLSREQVEADLRDTTRLAKELAERTESFTQRTIGAGGYTDTGARALGRSIGKVIRGYRSGRGGGPEEL